MMITAINSLQQIFRRAQQNSPYIRNLCEQGQQWSHLMIVNTNGEGSTLSYGGGNVHGDVIADKIFCFDV